jgi:rhodanese-related sulfurtransferase
MRGTSAYNGTLGTTTVTFTLPSGSTSTALPTVFEGHIQGAVVATTNDLIDSVTKKYKSPTDLQTLLTGLGLSSDKRTYAYCTAGIQASSLFFVLDGILGWPVELYDGSWTQWGLYATAANGGKLTNGSAWDTTVLSTISVTAPYGAPNYNVAPYADFTAAANYDASLGVIYHGTTAIDDPSQIEEKDAAYMSSGGGASGGSGGISPGC